MMRTRRDVVVAFAVVLAGAWLATALYAGPDRSSRPREVTLTGKIVDLQGYMTEKYASADHAKCTTDCIRAGVPAALETEDGLVIIGEGVTGPARSLAELALRNVELKGKLYERHGIQYIDIKSTKSVKVEEEPEDESWDRDDDDDE